MHQHTQLKSGPLTPTREDYLRALYRLSRSGGSVRLTDLARSQGVRLPTARHFVDRLREVGLAEQESYGRITLTHVGKRVGREITDRFELTRRFLIEVLEVPEDAAEREACVMEHHLDDDTLDRLAAFVKQVAGGASALSANKSASANSAADDPAGSRRT